MQYGFIIDNQRCIGCHACTVACKAEHRVPVGVNRTWVKYIEKGIFPHTKRFFSVMRCNHCVDAPCVEICPVGALFTRKDGIVDFNPSRCIGCKSCMQACPYDALYIDPENHTAAKCNYCAHRVEVGLEPACVNVCPTSAIISGDMENPHSFISHLLAQKQVQARKVEKGTGPKLFYIHGDQGSLNPLEASPSSDYMWSHQERGVGHFASMLEEKKEIVSRNKGILLEEDEKTRRAYDPPGKGILWGWEIYSYMVTKGIACGTVLVAFLLSSLHLWESPSSLSWFAVITALLFLAITNILLLLDLDRRDRFLYVLLRPQWKSWLVKGAYFMMGYGFFLFLWMVAQWNEMKILIQVSSLALLGFAFLSAIYTAFLFGQARGRDWWTNPLFPVHLLLHSLLSGVVMLLLFVFFQSSGLADFLRKGLILGISLQLLLILFEFSMPPSTRDSECVKEKILKGSYRKLFWKGVIGMGNIIPLFALLSTGRPAIWASSGVLVLLGIFYHSKIFVLAPQEIPLS